MMDKIKNISDKTYLPFAVEDLRAHFTDDADEQISYYTKSASRYHKFMDEYQNLAGIPLAEVKIPRQIEKDERFWTVTSTKNFFDHQSRTDILVKLLSRAFCTIPPYNWEKCLEGDLRLYFEACLPSAENYVRWLRSHLQSRQIIPYVLDAAMRNNARPLEGATHVDAIFINITNGFAWLIEAKILSDISYSISFDNFRNQIARDLDVMLDNKSPLGSGLENRDPHKSFFSLLTPIQFKKYPNFCLYGWIMKEYKNDFNALKRDLPHREDIDWVNLQKRIGWITFEDFEEICPGSCPWLNRKESPVSR